MISIKNKKERIIMQNALLSTPFIGILWLILLFTLSFFFVHLYKLVRLGQKYQKEKRATNETSPTPKVNVSAPTPTIEKKEEKLPPPSQGEPIYYIVERKRTKKPKFSEPKRIQFK